MASETMKRLRADAEAAEDAELVRLLDLCTPEQQEMFRRMYPGGPSREQMDNAFGQIERTLRKNAAAKEAPDASA